MYTLHYHDLHLAGRSYAFPCNKYGTVLLKEMCATMVASYNRVSRLVGIDYTYPEIVCVETESAL